MQSGTAIETPQLIHATHLPLKRNPTDDEVRRAISTFKFNSDAQARSHFDRRHDVLFLFGGVGSGKTVLIALRALDRSLWDTGGLHGFFTNTTAQLTGAVLPTIQKFCKRLGIQMVYNKRPPASWFRFWEENGIPYPYVAKYQGYLTLSTGFTAICGTLHNDSHEKYQSFELRSMTVEETLNNKREANDAMLERVRCGDGADQAECILHHRHQAYYNGNPPFASHYIFEALDEREAKIAADYTGPAIPDDGREWPLLRAGIGKAILIISKTSDNEKNLPADYRKNLASNYSGEMARRRLDGEFIREVGGRAYSEMTTRNVLEDIRYDPTRDLYVGLDVNMDPRIAVLAHPLKPGEYPHQPHERPGSKKHIGVFGEFFNVGGMSDKNFSEAFLTDFRGVGGDDYPNRELRGLPANWRGLSGHKGKIVIFSDSTAENRSVHDEDLGGSIEIIFRLWKAQKLKFTSLIPDNPAPRLRVHSVNAKLCDSENVISLWVARRALNTITDLERNVWDEAGMKIRQWKRGSKGKEFLRTHCGDGLGAIIFALFGLNGDQGSLVKDFNPTTLKPTTEYPW